jgi:serine/threonine protein kinase
MHGIVLFNSLDYVLTDLKLDNVLFNPKTGRIKLIDFLESYDLKAKVNKYMYTYYNTYNRHSFAEDVWRLGILMLQFLLPRVLQYKGYDEHSENHVLPSFIRNVRARVTKERVKYDYDEMIRPYLQDMYKTLVQNDPDRNKWQKLFPLVAAMLHNDPNKRPSVSNILRDRLFCRSCYLPRVDYSEDFTHKYRGYEDSKPAEEEEKDDEDDKEDEDDNEEDDVTEDLSENEPESRVTQLPVKAKSVSVREQSDDPSRQTDEEESSASVESTKQTRSTIPTKTKRQTTAAKRKAQPKKRLSQKKRKTTQSVVDSGTASSLAPFDSYSESRPTFDSDVVDLTRRMNKKLKKSSTFKSRSTTNATLHVPSKTQKRSMIRPRIRRPRVKRSWKPASRR